MTYENDYTTQEEALEQICSEKFADYNKRSNVRNTWEQVPMICQWIQAQACSRVRGGWDSRSVGRMGIVGRTLKYNGCGNGD